jgi:N-hydroxyarylamine O-acetyltransferase
MPLTHADLAHYCKRIGFDGTPRCDLRTLQALHHLHPLAIPFENLDSWLGRPVSLESAAVFDKLVTRRRGGYCFEQNLLFREVLEAIGFRVKGLAARVLWNMPAGAKPPRTHMLLLVTVDGRPYIADVGFGGLTMTAPLELAIGIEQRTPHETLRLQHDGEDHVLQAFVAGSWQPLYRFSLEAQMPSDYAMFNWHVSNHPQSRFVLRLMAGRAAAGMRHALLDGRYTRHYLDKPSEHASLSDAAELRQTLEQALGINLAGLPELDAKLRDLAASTSTTGA